MSRANPKHLAYVGKAPNSDRDSDSWYTPAKYMDSARRAIGAFDLDPFSSAFANETAMAARIITEEQDAFTTSWETHGGAVWMNPPYGRGIAGAACAEFIAQYKAGAFNRGIVLVNNATETKWFQLLLTQARAICLTDHRIAFVSPDGKHVSGNTRGQTFFLFNRHKRNAVTNRFFAEFAEHGTCLKVGAV
tara:strand:- start:3084 stop:3656 length:573 start_codon:yes stop_codon:yes gene_type:complete